MSSRTLQWLSLVGIIWLQSINGTNSNFPAYSSQLKNLLSISQVQLNNLAFASDAGKLIGWLSGIAVVYLPLWLVLIIGSSLGLLGYGLQYLFLSNQISLSYGHIFVLTVVAGNSICWINTVCYVVAIRNFPSDHQLAVGLTTSYLGLSAKIYTDTVNAAFSYSPVERAKAYLLLSSILPVIVSVIAAPLTREVEVGRPRNMGVGFIAMFVITMATGVYSVISSLASISGKLSPLGHAIGTGVFLLAPLAIPVAEKIIEVVRKCNVNIEKKVYHFTIEDNIEGAERMEIEVKDKRGEVAGEVRQESEGAETMDQISGVKESGDQGGDVHVIEEIGVKVMLKRLEFWLYFFVYFFGATLGLVFLNNLGQIAESRGYSGTSSLVSLSSSFGFFGRLMPSLMDYYFLRTKRTISKPASIVALMAPTAGAFFLLVSNTNLSLQVSTAIIGVCCGAITSVAVSTTTELFGTKNFSVNHNVVVVNIPIGSFLFGFLAAILYSKEGKGDNGECMGVECYRNTFIIWGSLCFLGTFLALILYARTRKLYLQNVQVLNVNFA
ncbi:protein NUCLEAR FUSION DEFECTIVE 4-like [Juglans microcarpa x Juglans regia]|uniref:protein NUCLEAR FUSION DEFECTIVE 4-like n=1 Tax=Juglans microcarpa x Juglans regia TaxID=2249226 RepID=UPI001B7F252C|nr:protein NUCLEAR FUSION DEFECTIVE 4-like [Juglans microcarpa x Juglans regia]